MRAVLQRVRRCSVEVEEKVVGEIGPGMLTLLGVSAEDTERECDFLAGKILNLRIFEDDQGKMNRSLLDIRGSVLVVSQFTLFADCGHGRRPSFLGAARPEKAIPLYERFTGLIREAGLTVATGVFGADMQVSLVNDGPVTIPLDTREMMPSQPEK